MFFQRPPLKRFLLLAALFLVILGLPFSLFGIRTSGETTQPGAVIANAPVSVIDESRVSAPVRFVAVGDTGSGASFQGDIAKQMLILHHQHPYPLVLHLGDIVYPSGDYEGTGDKLYTQYYRSLFERGVQFKNVLGNHDVRFGFKPGALAFYGMPGRYYAFSQKNVDFFAVDTNIMEDAAQRDWLDKALASSTADWKIVYGHHPIHSSGLHGPDRGLAKRLEPLLVKHHVDFYLAGHDHDYERFKPVSGVVHIISGGGGAYLRSFGRAQDNSLVRLSVHHFLEFSMGDKEVHYRVLDKTGKVIDQTVFQKIQPIQAKPPDVIPVMSAP